jgi:hypothetical protein
MNSEADAQKDHNVNFDSLLHTFINNILSLRSTDSLFVKSIESEMDSITAILNKMVEDNIATKSENEEHLSFSLIDANYLKEFIQCSRPIKSYSRSKTLITRGFLVSLISQWDAFIGEMIKEIFNAKAEIINSSEKSFTFSSISSFKSIDDVRNYLVEQEVDTVLRKNHIDQIKYLETKSGLTFLDKKDSWKMFVEATERRNLFVHTDGKVSDQYLKQCNEYGIALSSNVKANTQLEVSAIYFRSLCDYLIELSVRLVHSIWRKLLPNDLPKSEAGLLNLSVALLASEIYEPVTNILTFGLSWRTFSSDKFRLYMLINKAQSLKWSGKNEECLQMLLAEDWSATSDAVMLPKLVLEDKFAEAAELVVRIGAGNPEFTPDSYQDWPVFKEFRKSDEFLNSFKKVFGVDFASERPSIFIGPLDQNT